MKNNSKTFSVPKKCRICDSENMEKYLDLGKMPLANNLVPMDREQQDPLFSLEVQLCHGCFLSQLTVVVKPEILFSEYAYRTSISSTFQKHFEELAEQMKGLFPETGKTLVADIGSNDGCLLEQFKKHGFRVAGIEPAKNLAKLANRNEIPTINLFWGKKAAETLVKKFGKAGIITATNVFAHVDDAHSFLKNVKNSLSDDGFFIVEVPHALNLVLKNEFDTIYHEHLSYFLVKPLIKLFESEGMQVFDVQKIPTHGGSIRVFAKKAENKKIAVQKEKIKSFLDEEERNGLYYIGAYKNFAEKTKETKKAFVELISSLKKHGNKVAGYAASAKASTLLNYCKIGRKHIAFIIDDAPEKQNRAFAGNRVPIVPNSFLEKEKPDILVIFAWTIAKEIVGKIGSRFGGKYVIPMPFPRIIGSEKEL